MIIKNGAANVQAARLKLIVHNQQRGNHRSRILFDLVMFPCDPLGITW